MKRYEPSEKEIRLFQNYLESEEYAVGTTEKYLRDLKHFRVWLNGRTVTKQIVSQWKECLLAKGLLPITVNSKLAALNCFFKVMNWTSCQVKALRIQRRIFRSTERELGKEEYMRLIDTAAQAGKERLALLMETICATGIRVSEVRYITVEALKIGRAEIRLKGKIRTILLPHKQRRKLEKYVKKQKIASGEIGENAFNRCSYKDIDVSEGKIPTFCPMMMQFCEGMVN